MHVGTVTWISKWCQIKNSPCPTLCCNILILLWLSWLPYFKRRKKAKVILKTLALEKFSYICESEVHLYTLPHPGCKNVFIFSVAKLITKCYNHLINWFNNNEALFSEKAYEERPWGLRASGELTLERWTGRGALYEGSVWRDYWFRRVLWGEGYFFRWCHYVTPIISPME